MITNPLAFPVSAFFVLIIGFIWYNPKVFGTIWMKENGFTTEELRKGNMLKIFGFTYLFALMITGTLMSLTIHQTGAVGMIGGATMIETA
ncbi:DUF1761 domain-containing protein [Flavobacterium agrisoli]|uniref:DUF1761 domain-containing protein n=1 Tax=Flavobacterium agrisoli TaxID=2793066 RepID=UPI00293D4690|nr:DUF1761 domain-containing protein [Flavobacterium agrisoli]